MTNILQLARNIEPCQRNWDTSVEIPAEHVDYVVQACTSVPTKQNKNIYGLVVVQDRTVIEQLYHSAIEEPDYDVNFNKNSQVLANVVLIWTDGPFVQKYDSDFDQAIGISSATAALAASELGYATGFCKCFRAVEIQSILHSAGVDQYNTPRLILGFGVPNSKLHRRVAVQPDGTVDYKKSHNKKPIPIRHI